MTFGPWWVHRPTFLPSIQVRNLNKKFNILTTFAKDNNLICSPNFHMHPSIRSTPLQCHWECWWRLMTVSRQRLCCNSWSPQIRHFHFLQECALVPHMHRRRHRVSWQKARARRWGRWGRQHATKKVYIPLKRTRLCTIAATHMHRLTHLSVYTPACTAEHSAPTNLLGYRRSSCWCRVVNCVWTSDLCNSPILMAVRTLATDTALQRAQRRPGDHRRQWRWRRRGEGGGAEEGSRFWQESQVNQGAKAKTWLEIVCVT